MLFIIILCMFIAVIQPVSELCVEMELMRYSSNTAIQNR